MSGGRRGTVLPCVVTTREDFARATEKVAIINAILVSSLPVVSGLIQPPPLPAKLTPLHFDHQGGLMEQSNVSLQRGRQS